MWLPRPRGDGPYAQLLANLRTQDPLPTRGWTSLTYVAPYRRAGFPAHAGMDPRLR
ncbi:hypothetical protein [Microvirga aerophila]|uniref:hypothetical protein n=1 Tax=Microvirga aerophila TaxID=670291 RepID=UPI001478252D|nr:hypothetical protein [Microvirga aerophila]